LNCNGGGPSEAVMNRSESRFQGAGGDSLYLQAWLPEGPARAHLAIVHGVAEHSGRYPTLVHKGVMAGFGVWGFDLRGHGRSPGRPGHIRSWSEYLTDLAAFLDHIETRAAGRPRFVFGHSLGALIVLDFLETSPVDLAGAIISGAPIEPAGVAKPHLVATARLLSRLWPSFPLKPGIRGSQLTRDASIAAAYEADPLVHVRATARWGTECLAAVERVKRSPHALRLPVLFVHGGDDPLNLASGVQAYFERIPVEDKLLRVYAGSLHEPHNDLEAERVADELFAWIADHLG
jgi:alpha-beta hydrolase superfamily lysophospholipase